jgi:hypothetical protein
MKKLNNPATQNCPRGPREICHAFLGFVSENPPWHPKGPISTHKLKYKVRITTYQVRCKAHRRQSKMSNLSEKIDWAVDKFNGNVADAVAKGKSLLEAAEESIGLLFYVRKIYPKGRFPAWARNHLSDQAREAIDAYTAIHHREAI